MLREENNWEVVSFIMLFVNVWEKTWIGLLFSVFEFQRKESKEQNLLDFG